MIKNALLNRKSKSLSKIQRKDHSTYRDARNIGILYNVMEYDGNLVDELADRLSGDDKEVIKLGFSEKENEDRQFFCKKDVSMMGNLSKDTLGSFTRQPFDFLISLDTSGDTVYKYVLALSKAICKIGIHSEALSDVLLMTVRGSENRSQDIKELVRYLKMI